MTKHFVYGIALSDLVEWDGTMNVVHGHFKTKSCSRAPLNDGLIFQHLPFVPFVQGEQIVPLIRMSVTHSHLFSSSL